MTLATGMEHSSRWRRETLLDPYTLAAGKLVILVLLVRLFYR